MPNTQHVENRPSFRLVILLSVLLIAATLLAVWTPLDQAAECRITPDSLELAIAGQRFAEGNGFNIVVGGDVHPPRYPPWFSVVMVAPFFVLGGEHLGLAIIPVILMAILSTLLCLLIGWRLGGVLSGVTAASTFLMLKIFRVHSQEILTDVPCLAMVLLAFAIYLRVRERPEASILWVVSAASIITFAFMIRPVTGAALVPFTALLLRKVSWGKTTAMADGYGHSSCHRCNGYVALQHHHFW